MDNTRQLTIKDLLGLKSKFLTIISRFQINSMDKEDVLYEFIFKMLKQSDKDGSNYLERWDGSTALTTWFYKPLQNLCYSIKTRENSVGGLAINSAARLEESAEREVEFDGSTLYLENYLSSNQEDISSNLLVKQLLEIAKIRFSTYILNIRFYSRFSTFIKAIFNETFKFIYCLSSFGFSACWFKLLDSGNVIS